jgi:hypothetical protein
VCWNEENNQWEIKANKVSAIFPSETPFLQKHKKLWNKKVIKKIYFVIEVTEKCGMAT